MAAEALPQVHAQTVIDRTAIGEIRIHVAEGNAVVERSWITVCVESLAGEARLQLRRRRDTGNISGEKQPTGDRRIQATGPEKVHERGTHPRPEGTISTMVRSAANGKWTGR